MASNVGYSSVTSNVGANLNDKALTVDGGGYVRHRTPKHLASVPPVDWAAQGSDWGARLDGLRAASCSGAESS